MFRFLNNSLIYSIILIMWYCYLLSNQKNGNTLNSSIYGDENQMLNQELIYTCYQNQIKIQNIFQQVPIVHPHKTLDVIQIQSKDLKPLPEALTHQIFPKKKKLQVKNSSTSALNEQKNLKKSLKIQEQDLMKYKNPGRNSTSNIFRVFLKLCSKPKLESLIENKFKEIIKKYSLFISYQYYKIRLKEISPSTSNYINIKQFKKIWEGQSNFSKTFRCLFHWFLNSFAINHSLTLRGKHKMMKESIIYFLQNVHGIERELWDQQIQQSQKDDQETIKSEYTQ